MGSLEKILAARALIVFAGISLYFAYKLLPMPGLAGLDGLCFAFLAVGLAVAAWSCSVESYDEWCLNQGRSAL